MKRLYFVLGLGLSLVVAGSSCTPLEDMHSNPNATTNVTPESLLAPILYDISDMGSRLFYDFTSEVMQYTVDPTTTQGIHRYYVSNKVGEAYFYKAYKVLNNLYEMNRLAKNIEDNNTQAVALTLQAFIYANLADVFAAVPFSEACKFNEGIIHPKYEDQMEVYRGCLQLLDTAYNKYLLSETSRIAGMDIVYDVPSLINGVEKTLGKTGYTWRKFTNSLRLRLLMRLVDDPTYGTEARARLQNLISLSLVNTNMYGFLTSSDISAMVRYNTLVLNPNDRMSNVKNPLSFGKNAIDSATFNRTRAVSKFLLDQQILSGDVRYKVWFYPKDFQYKSVPSGFDPSQAWTSPTDTTSYSGLNYNNLALSAKTGILMTASEVQFTLAEAYLKGYATGTPDRSKASEFYNSGVNWAVSMWVSGTNVSEPSETWARDNEQVKWDNFLTNAELFERIMTQKYLALFFTDVQAWVEYRRTGLPRITAPQAQYCAGGNNTMPSRLLYPSVEYANNFSVLTDALSKLGGDGIRNKGIVDQLWNNNNFYAR